MKLSEYLLLGRFIDKKAEDNDWACKLSKKFKFI